MEVEESSQGATVRKKSPIFRVRTCVGCSVKLLPSPACLVYQVATDAESESEVYIQLESYCSAGCVRKRVIRST